MYSKIAIWLGLTIAIGAIISSYTVKIILPYLSDYIFKKIGYGSMVGSGIFLLVSTSNQIIKQDKISFSTNTLNETSIKWKESSFILEFAIDEGLEVERPIKSNELPISVNIEYKKLLNVYEKIFLEKVFKIGRKPSYEFYCYKNGILKKFEFKESEGQKTD